jgi:transcriptional regulator with XRE-family HTH domain
MKRKTNFDNFDEYPEAQLREPELRKRFEQAEAGWDIALQFTELRKARGLTQRELAVNVGASQHQISRLESPAYEGHSPSMLRRVVEALGGTVRVAIVPKPRGVDVWRRRPRARTERNERLTSACSVAGRQQVSPSAPRRWPGDPGLQLPPSSSLQRTKGAMSRGQRVVSYQAKGNRAAGCCTTSILQQTTGDGPRSRELLRDVKAGLRG